MTPYCNSKLTFKRLNMPWCEYIKYQVGKGPLWNIHAASILYKYTAERYRPVSYPDGPIMARCRFIKNAYWDTNIEDTNQHAHPRELHVLNQCLLILILQVDSDSPEPKGQMTQKFIWPFLTEESLSCPTAYMYIVSAVFEKLCVPESVHLAHLYLRISRTWICAFCTPLSARFVHLNLNISLPESAHFAHLNLCVLLTWICAFRAAESAHFAHLNAGFACLGLRISRARICAFYTPETARLAHLNACFAHLNLKAF